MGRMVMLEQVIASNMESQKSQMEQMRQELGAVRNNEPRTPGIPELRITGETPSKKRKFQEGQNQPQEAAANLGPSYANVAGVQPLEFQKQSGLNMLQNMLRFNQQKQNQVKSPRNI